METGVVEQCQTICILGAAHSVTLVLMFAVVTNGFMVMQLHFRLYYHYSVDFHVIIHQGVKSHKSRLINNRQSSILFYKNHAYLIFNP